MSILLLNRGGRPYKASTIAEIGSIGAGEIVSVEGPGVQYDVEALSRKFPHIRFLILREDVTIGEKINMGIEEAEGRSVFVLWNDMHPGASLSLRLSEKLRDQEVLCHVPLLQNQKKETLPTIQAPAYFRNQLRIIPLQPVSDETPTIFPFDYCGIYNRELFARTGGFDHQIRNPYWQKLDFGFRSYMWGERIICATTLRLAYHGEVPTEDATRDESYKLFFLKNLAIRHCRDSGHLPRGRFLSYLLKSGFELITACKEFREVRRWTEINMYRFKLDARSVTELWETRAE